jgi:hypothetical protein
MRHKYIILALAALLVGLLIIKTVAPTSYPLSTNYEWGDDAKVEKRASVLLNERPDAGEKSIKWDDFSIGDTREQMRSKVRNTTDTSIVLAGTTIPCKTTYFYDSEDRLIEAHFFFSSYTSHPRTAKSKAIEVYGMNYLEVYNYNKLMKRNANERYFWVCGNSLVVYEDDGVSKDGTLCVADITGLSDEQLIYFFRIGHVREYDARKPHIFGFFERESNRSTSTPSSTSTRTYKYGDSDTYQGSSQQKADLEAIDKYFGF